MEKIVILDFGSQYTQVIARRVREYKVYCEVLPFNVEVERLQKDPSIKGVIFSGGPASVLAQGAPKPDKSIFEIGKPILGICYGVQLFACMLGGEVEKSFRREYGHGYLTFEGQSDLFYGLKSPLRVWNSHGDGIKRLPKGFKAIGQTENSIYAAIEDKERHFYGLQFHPEVAHTEEGGAIIENFLYTICACKGDWKVSSYIDEKVEWIRKEVGNAQVILGLSGGVDSSVAAVLIHRAIKEQLTCVFIDNGLLRKGEKEEVERLFGAHFKMNLRVIDAKKQFLEGLSGVTDPEEKRKTIGRLFIEVFEKCIEDKAQVKYLAQGTIYPDVIESVPIGGNPAALIKSHHNVGGLPERMKLELLEPLRELFKDEVRRVGEELGLPHELLWRHPFPGAGLAIRVLGEVTESHLEILRQADVILLEELKESGYYEKVWQAFCVFLPVKSVGVMGDERTYDYTIGVRAIESTDGMTADWARLPYEILQKISNRIINEVLHISRVVYDISSKPPSTIEWE